MNPRIIPAAVILIDAWFGFFTVNFTIIVYNISKKTNCFPKYFTAIRKAVYKSTETKYFSPPVRRVIKAQGQNEDSSKLSYIMKKYDKRKILLFIR